MDEVVLCSKILPNTCPLLIDRSKDVRKVCELDSLAVGCPVGSLVTQFSLSASMLMVCSMPFK